MARVELPEVAEDFDRILAHLERFEAPDAAEIVEAIAVLPLIGRPTRADLRELIIGRRSRGYVALYRHVPQLDMVFVLAVRSQREAGYNRP